jgi:hypothetical protein
MLAAPAGVARIALVETDEDVPLESRHGSIVPLRSA